MNNCVVALALGLWMLGGCSARVVTVPPGPLIRVEGQPVSIRCDVKEYTGPIEQDFEWNMLKDTSGPKIKIISTFDSRYSDPSLSKRVASGDISVVRLQDNEVELKIAQVKLQDAGFYECQTPSTDYVISGNYAAKVQLTEPVKSYDSVPCYVVSSFLGLYSLIITSMLIKEKGPSSATTDDYDSLEIQPLPAQ